MGMAVGIFLAAMVGAAANAQMPPAEASARPAPPAPPAAARLGMDRSPQQQVPVRVNSEEPTLSQRLATLEATQKQQRDWIEALAKELKSVKTEMERIKK
jgi:hypothetical protein